MPPTPPSGKRRSFSRARAVAKPRDRLLRATTDAVAEHGYAGATIAEIIARAGVSRASFYEHFSGKRECFLAVYDTILADYTGAIANAYGTSGDSVERAQAALGALFGAAASDPGALRVAMVEIASVGDAGIARRESLISGFEEFLRASLSLAPRPGTIPNPVLRAVVGGISRILYTRVQSARQDELLDLVPDLVKWASSYTSPPLMTNFRDPPPTRPNPSEGLWGGRAPGTLCRPSPRYDRASRLDRSEHGLSRNFLAHSQRELILDAVANITAARGYAALTLGAIAEEAGVSLSRCHQHFAGKEDAFIVAYEVGHSKALAVVERASASEPDWRVGVRTGISALFHFLASEPSFAQMALVDALTATRRSAARSYRGVEGYARMLLPGLNRAPKALTPPAVTLEAITGGIFELCLSYALRGHIEALTELAPRASYFALAPFIGAEEAALIATGVTR